MNSIKITILIIGILFVSIACAQPPGPPATPIDGGLGLLLAGITAYGLKKLKESKINID